MYPYNHKMGQKIQTNADGVSIDRAFLAHYHVAAADAAAASEIGVLPLTELTAAVSVTAGLTSPKVPRNVQVDASAAMTTKVKVYGTNFAGEVISEELTLNGTTAVPGTIAFKTITKVDLPAKTHTATKQKTTSTIATATTKAGSIIVTITAGVLPGGHTKDVIVTFAAGDTTKTKTAIAIAAALTADATVGPLLTCLGAGETVTIESKTYLAQDATINLVVKTDTDSTSVAIDAITVDTVAGVAPDLVSVGWGDIFGLPYKLAHDTTVKTLFNNAADSMTIVTDADEIEKNTFDMTGTPDGLKPIDIYLIV